MNQNLLIVDDEAEILSWLAELFTYDFEMEIGVYTADSAAEALKLLNQVRFDVVLTDIRMPGMDGIALFERIKENWPRCKTVFLTGYHNFDDIYRVIRHKDVRYVLKSEDDEVIMEAVRDSFSQALQEIEQDRLQKKQEQQLERARYWMQRELMDRICAGIPTERLAEQLEELEIPIDPERKLLAYLIRIDARWAEDQVQEYFLQEEQLLHILQENMPGKICFHVHIMDRQQELMLIQTEDEDWERAAAVSYGMLEYAQEVFCRRCRSTFSAVVHAEPVRLEQLPFIIRSLRERMNRFIGGNQNVIRREKDLIDGQAERKAASAADRVQQLTNLLELRKQNEYFELLGECLGELMEKNSRYDTQALELYYSISIRLLSFINENHLNEELAFRIGLYKLTRAEMHESWMDAAQYLAELSDAVFSLLEKNEISLTERTLNRVIAYIETHLSEDLSLTVLAEVGGFNSSYLSRLFKQVTGEGISDFILHKRVEYARHLLAETNEKIQDIAAKTGYLSAHSFTRAFRAETGISPTEYRALHGTYDAKEGR